MGAKVQRLGTIAGLILCLVGGQGCASLSPNAARERTDTGGGLQVSDDTRAGIAVFGTLLWWAANILGD